MVCVTPTAPTAAKTISTTHIDQNECAQTINMLFVQQTVFVSPLCGNKRNRCIENDENKYDRIWTNNNKFFVVDEGFVILSFNVHIFLNWPKHTRLTCCILIRRKKLFAATVCGVFFLPFNNMPKMK